MAALAVCLADVACSAGASDSQIAAPPDAAAGDDGSATGTPAPIGQASVDASSSPSSSSSSSDAGAAGDGGTGGPDGGACPNLSALTQATRVAVTVSWPSTVSGNGGTGPIAIWLLSALTVGSGHVAGTTRICGVTLPDDALNGAGQLVTGGSKVRITFPPAEWDAHSMPSFEVSGTLGGWNPGDTIAFNPVLALIGLNVANPTLTWPSSTWDFPSGTQFPDSDDDGEPGITAVPLSGSGYTLPPTGLGAFGSAPTADKIYVALRSELALSGHWTSCTDVSGSATVTYFDNHVVGCHVNGGSDCTTGSANTQADFIDQSRTLYQPGSASFVTKVLPSLATCADALAALPN